jgi:CheY-like chemotaxis protein
MKILLVEDDATTRLLMERKLRDFDVDVAAIAS